MREISADTNYMPVIAGHFDDVVSPQSGDGSCSFRRIMTLGVKRRKLFYSRLTNECNLVTIRETVEESRHEAEVIGMHLRVPMCRVRVEANF